MSPEHQIMLGVSSCLLGEKVRYDGGHKRHHYITDTLKLYFNFVSVCPEVECGLSCPREAMQLWDDPASPRLFTIKTNQELTGQMRLWCDKRVMQLGQSDLRGFIFKKNSPSCGLSKVKIRSQKGVPAASGSGIFAHAITTAFPLLPVVEAEEFTDSRYRENFIQRIFAYDRLMTFYDSNPTKREMILFHANHKLLLMAHSVDHYRRLGRLVAATTPLSQLLPMYGTLFMEAFQLLTSPAKQTNVLLHCLGYFRKQLSGMEKQEFLDILEGYRTGHLPLIVPVTLLKQYIQRFEQPYLAEQVYFSLHRDELMLCNHP